MPSSLNKRYLTALMLSLAAFAISGNAVPPMLTTIAEAVGVDYRHFGYMVSLQFLAFAVASLTGAALISRTAVTERSLVLTGLLTMAAMLASLGSTTRVWQFAVIILVMGYAGGLTETFASVMILKVSGAHGTRMICLSQVFFCLGAVLAPQLVATVLALNISWRIALLLLSGIILAVAVLFKRFTRPTLNANPSPATPDRHACSSPRSPALPAVPQPLRIGDPMLILMAAALFLYVVQEVGVVCWVSTYFEKQLHATPSAAAWRLSVYWTGLVVGRGLAFLAPPRTGSWLMLILCSLFLAVIMSAMAWISQPLVATFALLLIGMLAGPIWPVTVALAQQVRSNPAFTSVVIGVGALGAAGGPALAALLIKLFTLEWLFVGLGAITLLLVLTQIAAQSCNRSDKAAKTKNQPAQPDGCAS